jgi:protein-L-isoaspartate(D-aspartate) O-methyltransferase
LVDYATLRRNMIEGQMRPNRILDRPLLDALGTLPRERFVPHGLEAVAYVDEDLPLGQGRFLTEPLVLARLIMNAGVRQGSRVLDVGCATGYGAAVMARLGAAVTALEEVREVADRARANLGALGLSGVEVVVGPLVAGWPAKAPYDAILIEGGIAEAPGAILSQLADGGALTAVVLSGAAGHIMRFEKRAGIVAPVVLENAQTPALAAFAQAPRFVF